MNRKVILSVVGARPQIIKAAALSPEIRKGFREVLLHTGQHYDVGMSQAFFRELRIPKPEINLGVGSGSHAEQTGKMMVGIEGVAERIRPDLVLVYGDTNSTLAGAMVAAAGAGTRRPEWIPRRPNAGACGLSENSCEGSVRPRPGVRRIAVAMQSYLAKG